MQFRRIDNLPPYVFAEVNRLKAEARARGADIIDLGMGNPDWAVPKHIRDKLTETVGKPLLYGTTKEFLRFFGLKDIKDLFLGKDFLVTFHTAPLRSVSTLMERVTKNASRATSEIARLSASAAQMRSSMVLFVSST